MTIPESHIQSYLQASFVSAIAAEAGYGCNIYQQDYGIDIQITNIQQINCRNGRKSIIQTGPNLDVQMKATIDYEIKNGAIVYELDADAHNRLAYCETPVILVLLCLPKHGSSSKRLEWDDQGLTLRHCCYWHRLDPHEEPTLNKQSVTVHIDSLNVFNVLAAQQLMDQLKKGAW